MSGTARRHDPVLVGLAALAVLAAVIVWLDNVHMPTMNGLLKSVDVDAWKLDPRTAKLDASNYLFFPLYGWLSRGLELVGLDAGRTWKQMAWLNAGFAAANVAIMFWLVRELTGRRDAALAAALLHLGSGFFLVLATSNEDIMSGYTLMFAAMALATVWFAAPTVMQVMIVGLLFTAGFLLEWRLMFPALPPLALSRHSLARRASLLLVLAGTIVLSALLVVIWLKDRPGAVGLDTLLWTGKGVGGGWSGFSWGKVTLMLSGAGEYLLGGRTLATDVALRERWVEWALSDVLQVALFVAVIVLVWPRRNDPRVRITAIVFLGALAAGQVMNAYSQPQDPQMQINVMVWLPVAWGLLAGLLIAAAPRRGLVLLAISALPLAYNIVSFAEARGLDGRMQGRLATIDSRIDTARTVFVYTGFEDEIAWHMALWNYRWDGVCDLGGPPVAAPKYKWVSVLFPALRQPRQTPAEHVATVKADLDCAFAKGYRVVAGEVWGQSAEQFADRFKILNARDSGLAIHTFIHREYSGTPLADLPDGVRYYELKRR